MRYICLIKIMRDESIDLETRQRAAYCFGLLYFAESIDDGKVRIDNDTQNKLETYLQLLKLKREMG